MVEVGTGYAREQNGIMVQETENSTEKGLKPAQVCASALAAVTAAILGSTLGVAGTIAGAGIASVVTTIGSEVYLRSLRKTREAARRTKKILAAPDTRLRQETHLLEPPPPPPNPLIRPEATHSDDDTVYLPRPGRDGAPSEEPTAFLSPSTDETTSLVPPPEAGRSEKCWWKSRWALASGVSVVAFVVGMLAITGFESLTGHAVSGGTGTTVGRVVQGPPPSRAPSPPATVTRKPESGSPATSTTTETSTTTTAGPAPSSSAVPTSSAPSSPVSPLSTAPPSTAPPSSG